MKLENVTDKNITPEIDEEKIQRMFGEQEELLKFLSEFEVDEEVFTKVVLERDALKFLYREYKDLEEQGLLLRLPCKVGDEVYIVGDRFPAIIESIVISEDNHIMFEFVELDESPEITEVWDSGGFELEDIGRTVFFTLEEAEQKLKEMEG